MKHKIKTYINHNWKIICLISLTICITIAFIILLPEKDKALSRKHNFEIQMQHISENINTGITLLSLDRSPTQQTLMRLQETIRSALSASHLIDNQNQPEMQVIKEKILNAREKTNQVVNIVTSLTANQSANRESKSNIISLRQNLDKAIHNLLSSKHSKRDIDSIMGLRGVFTEISTYHIISEKLDHLDIATTTTLASEILIKTRTLKDINFNNTKLSEPRIRAQLQQLQLKLLPIVEKANSTETQSSKIDLIVKRTKEINRLLSELKKKVTSLTDTEQKMPIYFRQQFQIIHAALVFLLTFYTGIISRSSATRHTSNEHVSSEEYRERQRKKELMKKIHEREHQISHVADPKEGPTVIMNDATSTTTKVAPPRDSFF